MDSGATTASGWGNGTLTTARTFTLQLLDYYSTPDPVRSVDVQGRKAYAGLYDPSSGIDSVRIFNISDPSNIQQMATSSASSKLLSVLVDGDILYLGTSVLTTSGWLALYNVSNPHSIPGPSDALWLDGNVTDLEVQGHFLYVAAHGSPSHDFRIFDVEDPTNIKEVGGEAWIDLYGLYVVGHLAYVADGTYGLYIRNVSIPSTITGFGHINTPGNATDVLVDGGIAFVADGSSGVQVVDVTDPNNPTIIGGYDTAGDARQLALQGDTLYVADSGNGLVVLDVADPTHPTYVERINLPYTWDVDLYGPYIVVATSGGIYTFLMHGGPPATRGLANLQQYVGKLSGYHILDVKVWGDIAYVAAGSDGLLTVNISNPSNPMVLDQFNHAPIVDYRAVDVQWPHCYIADRASGPGSGPGLIAVNVEDPASLLFMSRRSLTYACDVYVEGDIAYVANGIFGLFIINVSRPCNIVGQISSVTDGYNYTAAVAQGHFIYATAIDPSTGNKGLYVYDATDLSSPVLTDKYALSYLYDLAVDGDFCALPDGTYGTYLANISDPFNVLTLDAYNPPGTNHTRGIAAFGPYILAAERQGGLYLLNATDPRDMVEMARYNSISTDALRVDIYGDFAYVANRDSLLIFRLFYSPAATYTTGSSVAQSVEVDTTIHIIENATLTADYWTPPGTSISWEMSADGGAHWEAVTPSVFHTFTNLGDSLMWRATLTTIQDYTTPHIYSITINYEYNDPPTAPILNDPGDTDDDGAFDVNWTASTDPDGTIDHYQLQMSTDSSFSTVIQEWTPSGTSQSVLGLSDGTYYFRVRAFDNDGEPSPWSNVESITVQTGTITLPPPIPGFPIEAILVGAALSVALILTIRRRKHH